MNVLKLIINIQIGTFISIAYLKDRISFETMCLRKFYIFDINIFECMILFILFILLSVRTITISLLFR